MPPSLNWKQRRSLKETHDVAEDSVDWLPERAAWRCSHRAKRRARPAASASGWRSSRSRRWSCGSPRRRSCGPPPSASLVRGRPPFLVLLASEAIVLAPLKHGALEIVIEEK